MTAVSFAIRWIVTLVLAWRIARGDRWPIVLFVLLQAAANDMVAFMLKRLRLGA